MSLSPLRWSSTACVAGLLTMLLSGCADGGYGYGYYGSDVNYYGSYGGYYGPYYGDYYGGYYGGWGPGYSVGPPHHGGGHYDGGHHDGGRPQGGHPQGGHPQGGRPQGGHPQGSGGGHPAPQGYRPAPGSRSTPSIPSNPRSAPGHR